MHDIIDPREFDVVVASTGLVECLVASALLKAGKTVLLLDQADVYGGTYASYNFAGLTGSTDPAENPHSAATGPDQLAVPSLPAGLRIVQLQHGQQGGTHHVPGLPIQYVSSLCDQGPLSNMRRDYILDLAPRVMYQAEALVDVLVKTRCHNYLEFKALENSFIYQDGMLRPIPASRAEIFKDRRLGLADKRALMSFLSACIDAQEQKGPLAAALTSEQSFAKLLAQQGLPPHIQDIVMYGIALATSSSSSAVTQACSHSQPMTAGAGLKALSLYAASLGRFGPGGAFMFPTYGCGSIPEALVRHCAVKGGITALRHPVVALVVGSSHISLPAPDAGKPVSGNDKAEAGSEGQLVLQPKEAETGAGTEEQRVLQSVSQTSSETPGTAAGAPDSSEHTITQQAEESSGIGGRPDASLPAYVAAVGQQTPGGPATDSSHSKAHQASDAVSTKDGPALESSSAPSGPVQDADIVRGVLLGNGQLISCRQGVVISASNLHDSIMKQQTPPLATTPTQTMAVASVPEASTESWPAQHTLLQAASIARAVAVLDGPLVHGVAMCTISIPPDAVAAAVPATSNAGHMPVQPAYGLMVSHTAGVAPPDRYLLYLSTLAPGESAPGRAQQLLQPVLELLTQPHSAAPAGSSTPRGLPDGRNAGAEPMAPTAVSSSSMQGGSSSMQGGSSTNSTAAAATKPGVLQAHFYMQALSYEGAQGDASVGAADCNVTLANLVPCPTAGGLLHGYAPEVAQAEALLKQYFPDVPWLLQEELVQPEQGQGGDDSKQADTAGDFDDADFAIDELEQALQSLAADVSPQNAESAQN